MLLKRITLLSILITLVNFKALAFDDDEDKIDPNASFYMVLAGAGILVVGAIVSQAKFAAGLGRTISIIGLVIGGFGLLGLALILLEWAMKTAITLAIYIGAIVLAGYIIYQIYLWLFGPKKND